MLSDERVKALVAHMGTRATLCPLRSCMPAPPEGRIIGPPQPYIGIRAIWWLK